MVSTFQVLLVRRDIKNGMVVPYGATRTVTVKNVISKREARHYGKRPGWRILEVKQVVMQDPDARG